VRTAKHGKGVQVVHARQAFIWQEKLSRYRNTEARAGEVVGGRQVVGNRQAWQVVAGRRRREPVENCSWQKNVRAVAVVVAGGAVAWQVVAKWQCGGRRHVVLRASSTACAQRLTSGEPNQSWKPEAFCRSDR